MVEITCWKSHLETVRDLVIRKPLWADEHKYFDYHKLRYLTLCRLVEAHVRPDSNLLDIGCEPGHVTLAMAERFNCHGINLGSTTEFEKRMKASEVPLQSCDIEVERFPWESDTFDAIVCAEVLEHLFNNPDSLFQEANRLLVQGGIFILTTPNLAKLRNRLKLLLGRSINPTLAGEYGFFQRSLPSRHNREYTADEVVYFFRRWGFTIKEITFSDPYFFDMTNPLTRLKELVLKNMSRLYSPFGENIAVVGQKVMPVQSCEKTGLANASGIYGLQAKRGIVHEAI